MGNDTPGAGQAPLFSAQAALGSIYTSGRYRRVGQTAAVTEKATQAKLIDTGVAGAAEVSAAARAALAAQSPWAATAGPLRGDVLRRFADLINAHRPEIVEWIVRETGSIEGKGHFECDLAVREAIECAALASQPQGYLLQSTAPHASYARRVPIGVVGAITPWNSPFILAGRAIFPALALGNAVVLKPDVQTPVSGGFLLAELFRKAGLPDGVLHVLPGGPETGEAVVTDPQIRMISFTGSTAVGRRIGALAGGLLKRVALELGGNNAFIVCEDADVERAAMAGAFGSFFHQGQICFSVGRHIVHESVAPRYAERLAAKARAVRAGDPHREPVPLGPMINEKQASRAEKIMRDSIEQGAKLEAGGRRQGLFFEPTVLTAVNTGMPVFAEETFGPVAPIVTFRTDDEAVELANRTDYGLVAAVHSQDTARALRIAERLNTGIVHVNDQTVIHEVYGPIGGMGASGNGARSGLLSALEEYTQWRWITVAERSPDYPF